MVIKKEVLLLFSLSIILFLGGCNPNNQRDDLFLYKNTLLGDNSAVGSIVNQLEGAEHLKGFELRTNKEPYGLVLNYDLIESEQAYEKLAIHNATFIFSLIQNVEWITFHFDIHNYAITKEQLQSWYDKDLSNYENEDDLKALTQEYIDDKIKMEEFFQ